MKHKTGPRGLRPDNDLDYAVKLADRGANIDRIARVCRLLPLVTVDISLHIIARRRMDTDEQPKLTPYEESLLRGEE
jgi:hypothetical protein